jgi:hypothetical protein
MASPRIPQDIKRVLMESFTARDIAEPLASFDSDASGATVRQFMESRDFDAVGIRGEGQMVGYVERGSLQQGACSQCVREFSEMLVLEDTAPLLDVLMKLNQTPFTFVRMLGKVGAIITRADLQKPPVRMWLFGIVTLIETRCAELIDQHCPGESWRPFLSEGRLQKAQALLEERNRRNQTFQLVDCLQFGDKGQIIARNEAIRKQTIFSSRTQAGATLKRLERLRNNLAHAQDVATDDWEAIVQLCEFVKHN